MVAADATVVAVAISAQGPSVRVLALDLAAVATAQVQTVCAVALARAAAAALGSKLPDRWGIETAQDQGVKWLTVLSLQEEAAIVAMLASPACLRLPPSMHLTTPSLQFRPSYPSSPRVVFWSLTLLVAFSLELTQAQPVRAR